MIAPSTNGRTGRGRFAPGNAGGPGNPHARRVAEFRAALLDAVTVDDVKAIAGKLVERAKAGELPAIRELLDRIVGRPQPEHTEAAGENVFDAMYGNSSADDLRTKLNRITDQIKERMQQAEIVEPGGGGI